MSIFDNQTRTMLNNRADVVATAHVIADMFAAASAHATITVDEDSDTVSVHATTSDTVYDFDGNAIDMFNASLRYEFNLDQQGAYDEQVNSHVVTTDEESSYLKNIDSTVTAYNGCDANSLFARVERDCEILRDTYVAV